MAETDPEFRKHIVALLKLMIDSETGGVAERQHSEAEQNQGLSRDMMTKAIEYLDQTGLAHVIVKNPHYRYGASQMFVTSTGKLGSRAIGV